MPNPRFFSAGRARLGCRTLAAALLAAAVVAGGAGPGRAETRSLTLFNTHTQERATVTFKRDGRYVPDGLEELNRLLRDWRRNEAIRMDPALFDLIWEVYAESGSTQPIHVVCGYRSPETNNMLRARSRGVAEFSRHTRGQAMDFFIPDVPVATIRAIGLRKQIGGVGFYPGSNFVHLDTGTVRHWPRMTREQLMAVFPDGRTIHMPSNGKPLPGYEQALAQWRAKNPNRTGETAVARVEADEDDSGVIRQTGSFLARIFGGGDTAPAPAAQPAAAPARVSAAAPAAAPAAAAPADIPPAPGAKPRDLPEAPGALAFVVPRAKPVAPDQSREADLVTAALAPAGVPLPGSRPVAAAPARPGRPGNPFDAVDSTGAGRDRHDPVLALGYAPPAPAPARSAFGAPPIAAMPIPQARPDSPGGVTLAALGKAPLAVPLEAEPAALAAAPNGPPVQKGARIAARPSAPAPSAPMPADAPEGRFLDNRYSTRTRVFASFRKPDEASATALFAKPREMLADAFGADVYGGLRTDRFAGSAIPTLALMHLP